MKEGNKGKVGIEMNNGREWEREREPVAECGTGKFLGLKKKKCITINKPCRQSEQMMQVSREYS